MLFLTDVPIETPPLIQIVIEQKVEEPVRETPKVYTLEEKIELNVNNCNEETQYIRADDATCLAKPVYVPPKAQKPVNKAVNSSKLTYSGTNTYQAGQCVWHVKNLNPSIPNGWGSAYQWLASARAAGRIVSSTPRVGAAGIRGNHAVQVVGVSGNTVTISEMNYNWTPFAQRITTKSADYYTYIY